MSDVLKSVFQVNNKNQNTTSDPHQINSSQPKPTTLAENDLDWALSAHLTERSSPHEKL